MKKLVLLLCLLTPVTLLAQKPSVTSIVNPCTHFNTSFCTFAWNASTGCCVATFASPGADCGKICE
jgi:hypothetical protein